MRNTMSLPLSQEDWRNAVRSFIGSENRMAFAVEVCITASDGSNIAKENWISGERNAREIAEGVTEWIELRCDMPSAQPLEASISIFDKGESISNLDVQGEQMHRRN